MPTIHVLYDPDSKISGMPAEQLKQLGVSAIVMQIDAPTIYNIDTTIKNCVEMILEQVMERS